MQTGHRVALVLTALSAVALGAGWSARFVATAPSAPVVVSPAPTVAVTADVPPLTAQAVASPSSAGVSATATVDCGALLASLCPDFYKVGVGLAYNEATWQVTATALGYTCAGDTANAGKTAPVCGSAKLAGIDCQRHNAAALGACYTQDSHDALNAAFSAACSGYCGKAGIVSAPGSDPCGQYVDAHPDVVSAACTDARKAVVAAEPVKTKTGGAL